MPKPIKRPAEDRPQYPPLELDVRHKSPFLTRVYELVTHWVEEEWLIIDEIRRDTTRSAKATQLAMRESRLTLDTLAKRLDNVSQATLLRKLRKLGAPPPGEIIRSTRLAFARHLLIHTPLLVREVALRAGYDNESHFSEMFAREFGSTPSVYRRNHTEETRITPKGDGANN